MRATAHKQRRLSGLDAALQGTIWPNACPQSLLHVFHGLPAGSCEGLWRADGSGQRDDCDDLGDATDILQGLRFHMPGRQWQMLDDTVAAKLCRCCTWTRGTGGTGRPQKQVELLHKENRSLKQVVRRLRGLVRRLIAAGQD